MLPGTDPPGSITTHLRGGRLPSQHQTSRGVGPRPSQIYWHPTPRLETRYRTQAIRQGFDSSGAKLLRCTLRAVAQHINPCAVCRCPENTISYTTVSSLRLRLLAVELPRSAVPSALPEQRAGRGKLLHYNCPVPSHEAIRGGPGHSLLSWARIKRAKDSWSGCCLHAMV